MSEGVFWWVEYIVVQYWGWFLGYTIPILVGFYIVRWREKQGKTPDDSSFEYAVCIGWPIVLLVIIVVGVLLLLRDMMTHHIAGWVDSLILIIARRKIHSDDTGELWRSPAPNTELYAQWVKVKDKTGVHWIQVPLSIKTARDGVAWTYNLKEDEYHPIVRT